MRPRKLSDAGREEIEAVARARWALPADKELAAKHGVSLIYVKKIMEEARKLLYESSVSRETNTRDNVM